MKAFIAISHTHTLINFVVMLSHLSA
jgi:hypothetical protein